MSRRAFFLLVTGLTTLAVSLGCSDSGSGGGGAAGGQGGGAAAANSVEGLGLESLPGVAANLDTEYYFYSDPADAGSNPSVLSIEERMPAANGSGDRTVFCVRAQVPGPGFTDTGSLVPKSETDIFDFRLYGLENPTLTDANPAGFGADCARYTFDLGRRSYRMAEVETTGGSQIDGEEFIQLVEPSDITNANTTELDLVVCDDTITVMNLPFQHSHYVTPQVGWPVGWLVDSLDGQPLTVDRPPLGPVIDPTGPNQPPTTDDDFTSYASCNDLFPSAP